MAQFLCPCDATVLSAYANPTCPVSSRVKGLYFVVCGQSTADITDGTETTTKIAANQARMVYATKATNLIGTAEDEIIEIDHKCLRPQFKTSSTSTTELRAGGDLGANNTFLGEVNQNQYAEAWVVFDDDTAFQIDNDRDSITARHTGESGYTEVIFTLTMRSDFGLIPARTDISANTTLAFSC